MYYSAGLTPSLTASIVLKEYHCALSFGPLLELGIGFSQPQFHLHRVSFIRSTQRFLRSDLQLGQQPAYRRQTKLDAQLLLDEGLNNTAAPQTKLKTILPRVF